MATSPEVVRPSEWLPEVFGGQEAAYADIEEARTILAALMALYNDVNTSVRSVRPTLPPDCRFRQDATANFAEDAPVSRWSRGFMRGYQWRREDWDDCVPEELDQDFAALLMTLSFFATEALADDGYDRRFEVWCEANSLLWVRTVDLFWAFEYHRKGFPIDADGVRSTDRSQSGTRRWRLQRTNAPKVA